LRVLPLRPRAGPTVRSSTACWCPSPSRQSSRARPSRRAPVLLRSSKLRRPWRCHAARDARWISGRPAADTSSYTPTRRALQSKAETRRRARSEPKTTRRYVDPVASLRVQALPFAERPDVPELARPALKNFTALVQVAAPQD